MKFSQLSEQLDPEKKYHFTNKNLILTEAGFPKYECFMKPVGFWYSCGNSWSEWCIGEEFGYYSYLYEIEIDHSKVLKLSTPDDVRFFIKRFNYKDISKRLKYLTSEIDWKKVAENYSGIEINPFNKWDMSEQNISPLFILSWDVSSGCVWDLSILSYKLIATRENKNWRWLDNNNFAKPEIGPVLAQNA